MNFDSNAKPLRRGQAWVRRGAEDTAVYNPETGVLHLLNPSALAIWELCDGETTVAEIIEAVVAVTDVGQDAAESDVLTALQQLEDAGLVALATASEQ